MDLTTGLFENLSQNEFKFNYINKLNSIYFTCKREYVLLFFK